MTNLTFYILQGTYNRMCVWAKSKADKMLSLLETNKLKRTENRPTGFSVQASSQFCAIGAWTGCAVHANLLSRRKEKLLLQCENSIRELGCLAQQFFLRRKGITSCPAASKHCVGTMKQPSKLLLYRGHGCSGWAHTHKYTHWFLQLRCVFMSQGLRTF